ncbi:hypothetical protein IWZ01DRAFT_565827 [Phyllosticta capitalensis]
MPVVSTSKAVRLPLSLRLSACSPHLISVLSCCVLASNIPHPRSAGWHVWPSTVQTAERQAYTPPQQQTEESSSLAEQSKTQVVSLTSTASLVSSIIEAVVQSLVLYAINGINLITPTKRLVFTHLLLSPHFRLVSICRPSTISNNELAHRACLLAEVEDEESTKDEKFFELVDGFNDQPIENEEPSGDEKPAEDESFFTLVDDFENQSAEEETIKEESDIDSDIEITAIRSVPDRRMSDQWQYDCNFQGQEGIAASAAAMLIKSALAPTPTSTDEIWLVDCEKFTPHGRQGLAPLIFQIAFMELKTGEIKASHRIDYSKKTREQLWVAYTGEEPPNPPSQKYHIFCKSFKNHYQSNTTWGLTRSQIYNKMVTNGYSERVRFLGYASPVDLTATKEILNRNDSPVSSLLRYASCGDKSHAQDVCHPRARTQVAYVRGFPEASCRRFQCQGLFVRGQASAGREEKAFEGGAAQTFSSKAFQEGPSLVVYFLK